MVDAQAPGSAVRALGRARRRPPPRERGAIAAGARRILVLKPHDQLGDFVLATPAIHALRERFPEARIALLTRAFLSPLAERVAALDDVWALPRVEGARSLASLLATVSAVARFRPDLAFVMNGVSRSKSADAFAWLSGARMIVGRSRVFAGSPPADAPERPGEAALDRSLEDPLYDLDVPVGRASVGEEERLLDLVRWLGGTPSPIPRLDLSDADRAAGRARIDGSLQAAQIANRGPIVGLHPGAANELKCWPLESFVALGVGLATGSEAPPRLVVFDSPRERGRAAAVVAGLAARDVAAGLVPASGIGTFAGTVAAIDLLACNDSGVMHIAAAVGVPTVSFHSLGRPAEWAPHNDRAIAFHAPSGIAAIPVAAALEAVRRVLALAPRG